MVQCPNCSEVFAADFGMVSCPQCQQLLIVDIDGNVQLNESAQLNEPAQFSEPGVGEPAPIDEEAVEEEQSGPGDFFMEPPPPDSEPAEMQFAEPQPTEPQIHSTYEVDVDLPGEPAGDSADHESGPSSSADETVMVDPAGQVWADKKENSSYAPEDLKEIADYGNSELSVAKDGQFLYDLRIGGIDSADLKKMVEEGLTDRRLALNTKGLIKTIKAGVLEIKRINAIKTSILVNRFKGIPVSLHWRQNVITQIDLE